MPCKKNPYDKKYGNFIVNKNGMLLCPNCFKKNKRCLMKITVLENNWLCKKCNTMIVNEKVI
jgi:hypothetical protein